MRPNGLLIDALFCALLLLASSRAFGQEPPPPPPPQPAAVQVQEPVAHGGMPKLHAAIDAVYEAFARYDVVALPAGHGNQNLDSFLLGLLSDRRFPGRIDDIVVECGNALYQPLLDRYIAGDPVDPARIQKVWRNTTQPMCAASGFYQQLFPLVRRLNQNLPGNRRVRVLAADVPIDWERVKNRAELLRAPQDRDGMIASVMKREVLAKHRKALMLFGIAHLYHGPMASPTDFSAVGLYEKTYPGRTLVIADHKGFGTDTPYAKFNDKFESRLKGWPVPSIAADLKGTWLADALDKTQSLGTVMVSNTLRDGSTVRRSMVIGNGRPFSAMADAYLYLGPRDLLLNETVPASVVLDKPYMDEMRRRADLMGHNPVTDQLDSEKLSASSADVFFYTPANQ